MSAIQASLFANGQGQDAAQPAAPHGAAPAHTADQSQHQGGNLVDPAQMVDPTQQGAGPAATDADIRIPKARFDEVNAARRDAIEYARAMEARLNQVVGYAQALERAQAQAASQPQVQQAQHQEEPPLPDMINDPAGYAQAVAERAERLAAQRVAEVQRQSIAAQHKISRFEAERKFGPEVVEAAGEWVRQNGDEFGRQLSRRADPWSAAVELYRLQQLRSAVPDANLDRFREQVLRDALSNPEVLKQIAPMVLQNRPGVQAPPAAIPPPLSGGPRSNVTVPGQMFPSGMQAVSALLEQRAARNPR
jgi:hypothetical protein